MGKKSFTLDLLSNKTRNLQVKNTLWTMQESGERDALRVVVHKFSSLLFAWPRCFWISIGPCIKGNLLRAKQLHGPHHIKVSIVSSSDRATWQIWYTCVTNFFFSVQHHHLMCTNILYILCIQLLIKKRTEKKDCWISRKRGGDFFPLKPYCRCTWVQQSQSYAADASWCPATKLTKK